MKLKTFAFLALVPLICSMAPSYKNNNNGLYEKESQEVNAEIQNVLQKAKAVREDKERYEELADKAKEKKEREKYDSLAKTKKEELKDLLDQLEILLKKEDFIQNERGYPENQEDSPYQP